MGSVGRIKINVRSVDQKDTLQKELCNDAFFTAVLNNAELMMVANASPISGRKNDRILIRSSTLTNKPAKKIIPINIICVFVSTSPKRITPRIATKGVRNE